MVSPASGISLTYRISDRISGVNHRTWSGTAGEKLFLTPAYLEAIEQSGLAGMGYRYVEVFNNSAPAAILYFQLADLTSREMGSFLDLSEYGKVATKAGDIIHKLLFPERKNDGRYILVCGSLLVSGDHGYAVMDHKVLEPLFDLLPGIVEEIRTGLQANSGRVVAVSIKDFYEGDRHPAAQLARHGFRPMVIDPNMILDLDPTWKNWNDYLDAMSSKYRVRANAAMKKLEGVTFRYLEATDIERHSERLESLYMNVQKKAPVRIVRAGINYFISLKKKLGDQFVVRVFEQDQKIIAFTTGFRHGENYDAHFIGIDYDYNRSRALYLNILYDFIREAIASRSRRLIYGRTALEIKSTVGARPHGLTAFLKVTHPVMHKLIGPFVPDAEKEWVMRSPFR